jgi:Uma2 family endonuclease
MSVVTVENEALARLLPDDTEEWTVDDLARMPSDGLRYELFDGVLVVSPAPYIRHQRASRALFLLLDQACPPDVEVFYAPLDFQPTTRRSFQPDLLVTRSADIPVDEEATALTIPPLLAVEVLSKGTRSLDRTFKREMYTTSGIDNYWIFDPKAVEIVVYAREGTRYVESATAKGDQRITIDRPYPVRICPAEIVGS